MSGMSQDLSQQSRTQVCVICHIDTKSYHLNYGVSSCLSCRAFFRRIVQQKMKTEMKCKGGTAATGEPCRITPDNRKKCKKCRYEACLKAGMRADAVMSEDQYKVWFRRMLRKQKKEGRGGWGCNSTCRQGGSNASSRDVSSSASPSSGVDIREGSNDEDWGSNSDDSR